MTTDIFLALVLCWQQAVEERHLDDAIFMSIQEMAKKRFT